jgi:hypothetical protein
LLAATLLLPVAPWVLAQQAPAPPVSPHLLVITVKATGLYHLPSCPVVKDMRGTTVTAKEQAEREGFKPHDCQAALNKATASDKAQLVWVDLKTKRYHLAGCSLVGLPRAQVRLDIAIEKYRPCNACKPPKGL